MDKSNAVERKVVPPQLNAEYLASLKEFFQERGFSNISEHDI